MPRFMKFETVPETSPIELPAWNLQWLTPLRCRIIFALLLGFGFLSHLQYLHNCPVDLLGDEAQYWDWSRNLDWSYYSKGPLVALIIRASCSIFGDTMQAVRYPALVLGVGTSIFFYLTSLRLFKSDRLALGTVLLTHLVPMFIAGSVLMTIDPPYFFCWAAATYFAVLAIFERKNWAWIVAGLFIGIGFLAKYAALLWWVPILAMCSAIPLPERHTASVPRGLPRLVHALLGAIISLVFTIPVILWNHRHDWVTFRHVARQTGAKGGSLSNGNLLEFMGGQIGVVGPTLAVLMIAAGFWALNRKPNDGRHVFLVTLGLFFLACNVVISFFTKVQQNWPAPAYFTLIILTAVFIADRMQSLCTWRRWRGIVWATVGLGVLATPILHDISLLFPLAAKFKISPEKLDFTTKARGWEELGKFVSAKRKEMQSSVIPVNEVPADVRAAAVGVLEPPLPFILCDDYLQTAEMAFYVDGNPKTFYAGSYFADAKRMTQYDLWEDRRLDQPALLGQNAIYIGKGGELPPDIPAAFEKISSRIVLPIYARGVEAKSFKVWLCYGFKGMHRPEKKDF
jgi:hypothetical protein